MIVYQSLSEEDSLNHIPIKRDSSPQNKNGQYLLISKLHAVVLFCRTQKMIKNNSLKISKWLHSIQQLIVGYKDQ